MPFKRQLILFFIPLLVVISVMLTVFSLYQLHQNALDTGDITAVSIASEHSSSLQNNIMRISGYANALSAVVSEALNKGNTTREELASTFKAAVLADKSFFGMGLVLPEFDKENNEKYVDTTLGNKKGIFAPYLYFPMGGMLVDGQASKYESAEYFNSYKTGKMFISSPYYGASSGLLMVTMSVPIKVKDTIVGLIFVDLSLEGLSLMVENIESPYKGSIAYMTTGDGVVIACPNPEERMRNIKDFLSTNNTNIDQDLKSKSVSKERGIEYKGIEMVNILYPFSLLEGESPWYFGLLIPQSEVMLDFTSNLYKTLAIGILGLVVSIGVTFLVAGNISRSIQRITDFSLEISKGNYNASVITKGFTSELLLLKDSLTGMVASLLATMKKANESQQAAEQGLQKAKVAMAEAEKAKAKAEESTKSMLVAAENIENVSTRLSAAAEQLSAQVEESSRSADQQREQVGVSVTAMEQMNTTVLDVAQNASKASEGSEHTKQSAEEGAGIVKESIASIKEVEENVNILQEEMEGLRKRAESIGAIMTVISDIADQTNLLALNAAIEAARAGDAGRGFAVVADEVRKLAEKTMTATGEVGQAITGIQQGMSRSVSALGVTATNISKSTGLVSKSGEALSEIVNEAVTSASQISSIATAVEEQSASCQHINNSLLGINRISDELSTVMQESSQAIMDLSRQAIDLEELVRQLRLSS